MPSVNGHEHSCDCLECEYGPGLGQDGMLTKFEAATKPFDRRAVNDTAIKKDAGKTLFHLIPWDAFEQVAKVMTINAKPIGKYDEHNWAKNGGLEYSRPYNALMRHMTAWWAGEENDPETGLSHLAHACCNVLFLLAYRIRGMNERDNRPTK